MASVSSSVVMVADGLTGAHAAGRNRGFKAGAFTVKTSLPPALLAFNTSRFRSASTLMPAPFKQVIGALGRQGVGMDGFEHAVLWARTALHTRDRARVESPASHHGPRW
eukprot:353624-Chlamydomonas_euryale.AAC.2